MKKNTLFKIISILLPIIFLFIVEIVLRLADYGSNYNLFNVVRVADKPDYLVMNKRIAGKYFKENGLRADNQSDLFLRTKTDSTFRVFVQGASTVVGYPFYKGGSFPRMLKHRLSLTFPEKNIEVVNTGITAVNSYTLWDLTDDIIAQQPDVVIIYAGHNEYYGALGAGSSITYGSHPSFIRLYLSLKELRVFQLFENGIQKLVSSNAQKPSERNTTLMEVLAKDQRIPYRSAKYEEGLEQFEANLGKVLSKYADHDIPVILSTVVSNEKDIEPFISDSIPDTLNFLNGIEQESITSKKLARNNAKAAFLLGKHYLEKNQDSANKYLSMAKELDFLRFRAPEEINTIITDLSQKYHVALVDMEAVFRSYSPQSIIGDELMTEHVHPNIKGQFLMADAFYNQIKQLDLLEDWENNIGYDEAFNDIPVTRIDSLQGQLVVEELKRSWPYDLEMSGMRPTSSFNESTSFDELLAQDIHQKKATWDNAMALAYNTYKADGKFRKALHVAESLIFEYPEQGRVYQMAGEISLALEEFKNAAYYFSKSNYLDSSVKSAEGLAKAYIQLQMGQRAEKVLSVARNKGLNVRSLSEIKKEITTSLD